VDGTIQEYEITRESFEATRQYLTRRQMVERIVEAGRDPVERDNLYRVLSTDRVIEPVEPALSELPMVG